MHRTFIAVIIAGLLVLAATATTASAHQRHGMSFDFAQMVAADYWQQRDVTVPCHPRAQVLTYEQFGGDSLKIDRAPYEGGWPDMVSSRRDCLITVMPWAEAWRKDRDPEIRAGYCWDIAHEVGHLAGLEHPDQPGISDDMRRLVEGTVMNEAGAPYPFGCEHPRQWLVRHGVKKAPRWVRSSPRRVQRLWLSGHVRRARLARARWLDRRR